MEHLVRVYNEKDRQTLDWLRRHVGDAAIASAVAQCALSTVCRRLGGENAGVFRAAAKNVESGGRTLPGDHPGHSRGPDGVGKTDYCLVAFAGPSRCRP